MRPFRAVEYHRRSKLEPPTLIYQNGEWFLAATYVYQREGLRLEVPEGFNFDLASVPRFLWWFIAPFELSIVAPLVHDFLYRYRGVLPPGSVEPPRTFTRREADVLFLHIMQDERIGWLRSHLAYAAVRVFGWLTGWRTL